MSSGSKRGPPRGRKPSPGEARRSNLLEDVEPLRADDPRPQRVAQYPSTAARRASRRPADELIPTSLYDVDQELPPSYASKEVSDPGTKPVFLYVEKGPGAGQLVPVKEGQLVIGRASVSDLRLQHPSISRRHAQLTRTGERFHVRDLGSQNGTYVNKVRIGAEMEVYPGDTLSVGNAVLKLRGPLQPGADRPRSNSDESPSLPLPTPAPRRSTKSSKGGSMVRVAIFAGAVGFGLAGVLMFALVKLPSGPSYQNLEANRPVETSPAEKSTEAVASDEKARIEAALKKAMERAKSDEPAVEASEPAIAVEASPTIKDEAKKVAAVRPAETRAEPSSPKPTSKKAAILARYEEGDAQGALELAKRSGESEVAANLERFLNAHGQAEAAVRARDGRGAIKNYSEALRLDELLSSGWSKYGAKLRRELGGLWVLAGEAHLNNRDTDAAKKAFRAALKYTPDSAKAKEQLAALGDKAPSGKSKIDEAWGDDPPTKPKAKGSRSAIDDAFDE